METASPDPASSSPGGSWSVTGTLSWFSINRTQAPNQNSPKIFPPSSTISLADSTDSAATGQLSKRIRVYPAREQKKTIKLWFDAARWCYNKTIETLRQPDTTANWKKIKTPIIRAVPSHLAPAPYQVKSIAVRDACKAVSNAKIFNIGLKKDQAAGIRLDETFAEPDFRRRKNPHQNCFIPARAVFPEGPYPKLLGALKMAETPPEIHRDSRLTLHNGKYHLSISTPAACDVEDIPDRRQARVAALDPGIRSFMTWYSETDTGHIGRGAFGRIQRLCQHLDDLTGRTAKAPRNKRPNMRKAARRMRNRIQDLIQELHHQTARFLVDRFDLILLPTFETRDMIHREGEESSEARAYARSSPSLTTASRGSCCGKRGRPAPRCCWSTKRIQARPAAGAEK